MTETVTPHLHPPKVPARSTTAPLLSRHRGGGPRSVSLGIGVGLLLVLAALAPGPIGGAAASQPPRSAGPWVAVSAPGAGTWENGIVRVAFPSAGPTMTIWSIADPRVAATLAVHGLAEVAPNGSFSVFASFDNPNVVWHLTPTTASNGTLDLAFRATVPEVQVTGVWESQDDGGDVGDVVGNASVRVDVYLNDSAASSATAARVAVSATNWTWGNSGDSLGLSMVLFAAKQTRIASKIGPSDSLLQELANATGKTVASLSWARSAKVVFGTGAKNSSQVASYSHTTENGSNSTVRLLFGNVTGGYDSIEYDPWLALNLGAFAPGRPAVLSLGLDGWIVLGVAVGVLGALAVAAARRGRSEPDELRGR